MAYFRHGVSYGDAAVDPAIADLKYQARARIFETLGLKEKAIADFRQALAIAPNHQEVRDALRRLGASP